MIGKRRLIAAAAGLLVALHVGVPGGRLGFFITGFIGACILIFLAKFARR